MCGAELAKGGLYLGKHEGDTLHLVQIVLRLADGQLPHLDFMTPIGVLAFAPIALFVHLGYGVGSAIILSQLLVSAVFLPIVWWAAYSRLRGVTAYLFGLFVFVLIAALVHGEAQRSVSISMHYNRWAWAAAFVAILLALVPARGRHHPVVDGSIIGLAMAALALTKMTYFAAFALPVLVALLLNRNAKAIIWAIAAGLAVAAIVTAWAGIDFWRAYLHDLAFVAASDVRPNPGEPFDAVVGAPAYLGASLSLLAGVILLRQARQSVAGLVLLLLAPGFFYVTYQNFGNDPQWLLLVGILLLAFMPRGEVRNGIGWDMRGALKVNVAIVLALASPSFFNLAYSPYRHLNLDTSKYAQLIPGNQRAGDLMVTKLRGYRAEVRQPLSVPGDAFASYNELSEKPEPTAFRGEKLPECELQMGMAAWFKVIADDLDAAGFGGSRIFAADLFSSHWLFGDFKPLEHGAPWFYGGLPGFQSADYLLVPLCPVIPDVRKQILENVEEAGTGLEEVRRTPLYILYRPLRG